MRRVVLLAAAAVLVAVGAYLARRADGEAAPSTGRVGLIGDSLNVGVEPHLEDALRGWRLETDDVVGRSTADGLEALERAGHDLAPWVVISLGTNDAVGDPDGFSVRVERALELAGPERCVVWATIRRDGDAYEPFNEILRAQAEARPNLVLVDWARMVADDPGLLAGDGVHGTEAGYAARASAVADAVRSCPVVGGS